MTTTNETIADAAETVEEPLIGTFNWVVSNWDDLLIGGAVALGIIAALLVLRTLGKNYRRRTQDRTSWKGIIAGVFAKTKVIFMVVLAIDIVINQTRVPERIDTFFDTLMVIVAALQGAIWVRELILGVVKSKAAQEEDDPDSTLGNAISIIRVFINVAVFALAGLFILGNLGVNVLPLITGLGIGGIAIGLAAQGIFEDLFAALSIVFDRPFRRGDQISYGSTFGTVEKIGMKTTRLRAVTGEQIVIGNTQLLGQEVKNIAMAERRRVEIPFGVIYQTPPEKLAQMKALVEGTIRDNDAIEPVRTVCTGFGDSSIDFIFIYDHYTTDYEELVGTKSLVLIEITRLFAEQGIEFAYPTQTTFTSAPDGTMIMPYPEGGFKLVEDETSAPARMDEASAPRTNARREGPGASDTDGDEG